LPPWCAQGFHSGEADGNEWMRTHEGPLPLDRKLGAVVTAYAEDRWSGGAVECTQCLVVDGTAFDLDTWAAIPRLLTDPTNGDTTNLGREAPDPHVSA
jgi:hypothetical protein